MRILTTLLALLLASPVFAETWVCSYEWQGEIEQEIFTRSDNRFITRTDQRGDAIVYEDEFVIVLHDTATVFGGNLSITFVTQIDKSNKVFITTSLQYGSPISKQEGPCVIVE